MTEPSNIVSARPECWGAVPGSSDGPRDFALGKSCPNPFGAATVVSYDLPGPCTRVRLVVYDAVGREVRRLVDGSEPAGHHEVKWDGRDAQGLCIPPGVYFYRLEADGASRTDKILFLE